MSVFPYFGCTIHFSISNWADQYINIRKAQWWWVMVAKMLVKAGVIVHAPMMIYKALVYAVFLYSTNIWVFIYVMLKVMDGFHLRVAWRISGMTAHRVG